MKSLTKQFFFINSFFNLEFCVKLDKKGCFVTIRVLFTADVLVDTFLIYIPQLLKVAANQTLGHLDCGMWYHVDINIFVEPIYGSMWCHITEDYRHESSLWESQVSSVWCLYNGAVSQHDRSVRAVADCVYWDINCLFIVGKQFQLTSHSCFVFCASYFSPETGDLGCLRFLIVFVDCSKQVLGWLLMLGHTHFHILCISLFSHHLIIQLSIVLSYWQHCQIDKTKGLENLLHKRYILHLFCHKRIMQCLPFVEITCFLAVWNETLIQFIKCILWFQKVLVFYLSLFYS